MMGVNQISSEPDIAPKLRVKQVARRLFAERGIHAVTVREIAQAANQRNLGVVAYYFTTKDNLIREILIDGAERIEARRREYLSMLEADGGPNTVEDVVAAIVLPSARFAEEDPHYGSFFNQYLYQLSLGSSDLIDDTLEGRWNEGYQRCLAHMRHFLVHLSKSQQNRRFVFMASYVSALLAQRELMLADRTQTHRTWKSQETLDDIIATTAALLLAGTVNRRGGGTRSR